MNVLGLSFGNHDSAAALAVDGHLVAGIARERLTRLKHDGILCGSQRLTLSEAVAYCLEAAGLSRDQIDVVVSSHVDARSESKLRSALKAEQERGAPGALLPGDVPWMSLPHHFAHACSAFYLSPFDASAVMVVDGSGQPVERLQRNCTGPEVDDLRAGRVLLQGSARHGKKKDALWEVESYYTVQEGQWRALRKVTGSALEGSIGPQYSAATQVLFDHPLECGKTMGLAPYGQPLRHRLFLRRARGEPPLFLPLASATRAEFERSIRARQLLPITEPLEQCRLATAYAATVQAETEEALLEQARWLRETSGLPYLCLAGGVALNCVANSRLARESGFRDLFVPPAPGDDGIAIGCALYGAVSHGERISPRSASPFLGRGYEMGNDPAFPGLRRLSPEGDGLDYLADRLAAGAVVAFHVGGSEFGPRALGQRSFLADPRDPGMRDRLNRIIKRRDPFRPFAPVILAEAVEDFFLECFPSRYMSFVSQVRPEQRERIPAVLHVDGTARYQVLRAEENPVLHELLQRFRARTGLPLLLNTSFNQAGEPLVETPAEARRCFLASGADYLYLEGALFVPAGEDHPE
jgi:carbamoyltransferase